MNTLFQLTEESQLAGLDAGLHKGFKPSSGRGDLGTTNANTIWIIKNMGLVFWWLSFLMMHSKRDEIVSLSHTHTSFHLLPFVMKPAARHFKRDGWVLSYSFVSRQAELEQIRLFQNSSHCQRQWSFFTCMIWEITSQTFIDLSSCAPELFPLI